MVSKEPVPNAGCEEETEPDWLLPLMLAEFDEIELLFVLVDPLLGDVDGVVKPPIAEPLKDPELFALDAPLVPAVAVDGSADDPEGALLVVAVEELEGEDTAELPVAEELDGLLPLLTDEEPDALADVDEELALVPLV